MKKQMHIKTRRFPQRLLSSIYTGHAPPFIATTLNGHRLEELASNLPPLGPAGVASPLLVEKLPINLATTRVDIDFGKFLPGRPLPDPASNVECKDHEEGEVRLEEAFGTVTVNSSVHSGVELSDFVSIVSKMSLRMRRTCAMSTTITMIRPIQDPVTPKMALKGISSRVWPWYFHAFLKRMWAKQMLPQVKSAARPERDCSQSNAMDPPVSRVMKASGDQARTKMVAHKGRPARSTYVKKLGA